MVTEAIQYFFQENKYSLTDKNTQIFITETSNAEKIYKYDQFIESIFMCVRLCIQKKPGQIFSQKISPSKKILFI